MLCLYLQVGDETMSVLEIWGAEYQENDCLLIKPESRDLLQAICDRERCFMQVGYQGLGFWDAERRVLGMMETGFSGWRCGSRCWHGQTCVCPASLQHLVVLGLALVGVQVGLG
jgi:hypothetical protein